MSDTNPIEITISDFSLRELRTLLVMLENRKTKMRIVKSVWSDPSLTFDQKIDKLVKMGSFKPGTARKILHYITENGYSDNNESLIRFVKERMSNMLKHSVYSQESLLISFDTQKKKIQIRIPEFLKDLQQQLFNNKFQVLSDGLIFERVMDDESSFSINVLL